MPRPLPPILRAALKLHRAGFWIVPCRGKRATVRGWNKTRVPKDELRAQLLADPSLNIAIVLNQSALIDVECDSEEAEARLQEMFGGEIPPTPTWCSARGLHRLFLRAADVPKKAKVEIDGVEFRLGNSKGALSIVPPSLHPDGTQYEWLDGLSIYDIEPAELPASVAEKLKPKSPPVEPVEGDEIPEGKRNDSLFKLGCRLRESGLSAASIESALSNENKSRCMPPLSDAEVASIAKSAAEPRNGSLEDRIDLWHTPDDTAYATIDTGGHHEHWPVRSTRFGLFVRRHYYETNGVSLSKGDLEKIVDHVEAEAIFRGGLDAVHLRTAEHDGRFYLDLANESWQAVEIDADGWRVLDRPPVRFRRTKGMQALPAPVAGGTVEEICRFVNVRDEDLPLVLAFLTFCFRPGGPYAILKVRGEQGSAKSTTIRVFRSLIDPNSAPARTKPPGERELAIAVSNTWLYCLDNLSFLGAELSDAICRLSTTGAGYCTRKLYTDDDEVIFNAVRPVILAGIEDVGSRSDLLDRSVTVELPTIAEDRRRDEKELWSQFEEARPRILGALLDAVAAAIGRLPDVRLKRLPRMADFLRWATAAEEALGFEPGTCEKAYEQNREEAHLVVLEESPVAASLIRVMQRRGAETFEGTATELLAKLKALHTTEPEVIRQKSWPKNPRALSAALSRLAPNLRHIGIVIDRGETGQGNDKRRTVIVRVEGELPPMSADDRCVVNAAERFRAKAAERAQPGSQTGAQKQPSKRKKPRKK